MFKFKKHFYEWQLQIMKSLKKKKEYGIGGIVPQDLTLPYIDFKVEKVYDFKKGGRYFFIVTTEKPLTNQTYDRIKRDLKKIMKRIGKDLDIISSFILLDNGIDIKVMPSGEERKSDPELKSYIEKGYTPTRKDKII